MVCMHLFYYAVHDNGSYKLYGHGSYKVPTCVAVVPFKVPTSMVMVPTSMVLIRFLQCTCMAMEWCWDSDWSFSIPWLQSGLGALANILIYTQEYSVLLAHTTTLPERREGGGEEGGGEGVREREEGRGDILLPTALANILIHRNTTGS